MYDLVEGKPYYNQGTGDDFNYGPKITEVEYLESTNDWTTYIDTGLKPTANMGFLSKIKFLSMTSGDVGVIGARDTARYQPICLYANRWTASIGNDYDASGATANTNTIYDVRSVITDGKTETVYVNGIQASTKTSGDGTLPDKTFYLFARNTNDIPNAYSHIEMWYMKIYSEGILVRDFIPVKDENNVGYMFDTITHSLYGNKLTGSFGYGNIIKKYTLRLLRESNDVPTTYKRVSYLQSTGTQYIDTGLKGKNGYDFDFKFNSKIDGTAYGVGGEWESGKSCYLGVIRTNNKLAYHYKDTSSPVEIQELTSNIDYTVQAHLYSGEQYYVINGTKSAVGTISGDFTSSGNVWLFAINASTVTYSNLKMYYTKIYDNGVLVRDFVPVIRKSDNKPGMWDKVTRTFYTNAASTGNDFNYGE